MYDFRVWHDLRAILSAQSNPARVQVIFVMPTTTGTRPHEEKVLKSYLWDLHALLVKKLQNLNFGLSEEYVEADSIKLMALLQEMIKIRKLLTKPTIR